MGLEKANRGFIDGGGFNNWPTEKFVSPKWNEVAIVLCTKPFVTRADQHTDCACVCTAAQRDT